MKTKFAFGALGVLGVVLSGGGMAFAAISGFTINPTAPLSPDRTVATVTGSIECTAGDTVNMTVQVFQVVGGVLQTGNTLLTPAALSCSGGVNACAIAVTDLIDEWQPGPASGIAIAVDTVDSTLSRVGAELELLP